MTALQCRRCGSIRDPRQYDQRGDVDDVAWEASHARGNLGL